MRPVAIGLAFASVFSASTAVAFRQPDKVVFSGTSVGFEFRFRWDVDPEFATGQAAEFEVNIAEKCFAAPAPDGKDTTLKFSKDRVLSKLSEQKDLGAYVDVWNYVLPTSKFEAVYTLLWECGALDPAWVGADVFYDSILKPAKPDPIGNFAVGVRNASNLHANVDYWIKYSLTTEKEKLAPECQGTAKDASLAWLRIEAFANSCTHNDAVGSKKAIPIVSLCPFLLGFKGCSEAEGKPNQGKEVVLLTQRLCLPLSQPTKMTPSNEPKVAGVCVDSDGDSWLRSCGDPICSFKMLGDKAKDCDDTNPNVKPTEKEKCSNGIDDDCNGVTDFREIFGVI